LTNTSAIEFALPLRESDTESLDDRVYGPFESRLLFRAAQRCGMTAEDILRNSQIRPEQLDDAKVRVSGRQRLSLYHNILAGCDDPGIFLRAGDAATICSFGLWGYVLMSSSTYLNAIHVAFKYLRLTGPLIDKTFDVDGDVAMFEGKDRLLLGPLLQPVADFWFAFIVRVSREVTRDAFEPALLELEFPRPGHGDAYEPLFGCPVRFETGRNRICFDVRNLEISLPRADALSHQICEQMCATLVEEMKLGAGPARDVRDLIMSTPRDFPSLSEVARRLYTTPRTLRRKLAEQGTSYQQILNDVRKRLAISFLRETSLSMDEIAERVGFSDSRNFRHAFKKWTDSTPSSHRAQH